MADPALSRAKVTEPALAASSRVPTGVASAGDSAGLTQRGDFRFYDNVLLPGVTATVVGPRQAHRSARLNGHQPQVRDQALIGEHLERALLRFVE